MTAESAQILVFLPVGGGFLAVVIFVLFLFFFSFSFLGVSSSSMHLSRALPFWCRGVLVLVLAGIGPVSFLLFVLCPRDISLLLVSFLHPVLVSYPPTV